MNIFILILSVMAGALTNAIGFLNYLGKEEKNEKKESR